eukprot:snap_masked-scaffold_9-processed-gene-5.34-mRNA-1 protein AED:1.00 eAED:1.00 QI:0/0/0/0/1/1/3/0/220
MFQEIVVADRIKEDQCKSMVRVFKNTEQVKNMLRNDHTGSVRMQIYRKFKLIEEQVLFNYAFIYTSVWLAETLKRSKCCPVCSSQPSKQQVEAAWRKSESLYLSKKKQIDFKKWVKHAKLTSKCNITRANPQNVASLAHHVKNSISKGNIRTAPVSQAYRMYLKRVKEHALVKHKCVVCGCKVSNLRSVLIRVDKLIQPQVVVIAIVQSFRYFILGLFVR